MKTRLCFAILFALALPSAALPQAKSKKSDGRVKIAAAASKVDSDGKQLLLVTLDIDKGWHAYANPVENDNLKTNQVQLKVSARNPISDLKIVYPPGKLHLDKILGDYKLYEDKVAIRASLTRTPGDTSPLDVIVKIQVCEGDKQCLPNAEVKLTVK